MSLFKSPDNLTTINVDHARNPDIVTTLEADLKKAIPQCIEAAKRLKGKTVAESCFNVHKFIRNHIKYLKDDDQFQDIQLPNRLIANRKKGGDCKSFSLLAASILNCMNIPCVFRYASYPNNRNSPIPTHVYVVAYDKGREIIVDSTLKKFNYECPYYTKQDSEMQVRTLSGPAETLQKGLHPLRAHLNRRLMNMRKFYPKGSILRFIIVEELHRLQGKPFTFPTLNADQIARLGRLNERFTRDHPNKVLTRLIQRKYEQLKGTATKVSGSDTVQGIGRRHHKGRLAMKLLHIANLTALAPARHALLMLIGVNFRGLAGKFAHGLRVHNKKLLERWYIMGGSKKMLVKITNSGRKKKPMLGGKKTKAEDMHGVGFPPMGALLAAAGTILTALAPLFKGSKDKNGKDMSIDTTAAEAQKSGGTYSDAATAVEKVLNPSNLETTTENTKVPDSAKDENANLPGVDIALSTPMKIGIGVAGIGLIAAVAMSGGKKRKKK